MFYREESYVDVPASHHRTPESLFNRTDSHIPRIKEIRQLLKDNGIDIDLRAAKLIAENEFKKQFPPTGGKMFTIRTTARGNVALILSGQAVRNGNIQTMLMQALEDHVGESDGELRWYDDAEEEKMTLDQDVAAITAER